MDSLTESEISLIARHQRDVGLQRLSSHFSWTELCDELQCFHQEFVYDVTMFASACGFSWFDVIRAAVMAKHIFPQLKGLNRPELLSLLRDALSEGLPNITPVQRHQFSSFLTNLCITRTRLFQAVVSGAVRVSTAQLHLEVQLPPTPCPLAQGTDLNEWERQHHQAQLTQHLDQKVGELRVLREGSRVALGDLNLPEGVELDEKGVLAVVRTTVRASTDQMLASLTQEASLLSDIHRIRLQQAALATGGHPNPVLSNPSTPKRASANSIMDKKVSRNGLRRQY